MIVGPGGGGVLQCRSREWRHSFSSRGLVCCTVLICKLFALHVTWHPETTVNLKVIPVLPTSSLRHAKSACLHWELCDFKSTPGIYYRLRRAPSSTSSMLCWHQDRSLQPTGQSITLNHVLYHCMLLM